MILKYGKGTTTNQSWQSINQKTTVPSSSIVTNIVYDTGDKACRHQHREQLQHRSTSSFTSGYTIIGKNIVTSVQVEINPKRRRRKEHVSKGLYEILTCAQRIKKFLTVQ